MNRPENTYFYLACFLREHNRNVKKGVVVVNLKKFKGGLFIMEFTPWKFFVDLGLISLLFLIGKLIRAKVKFVQELFLPASLLAGLLGLIFGPNGLGILPFSEVIGVYPGILIALVFGALPLGGKKVPFKTIYKRIGNMWAYSQAVMICQWGAGMLFGLLVLKSIWGNLHNGFGLMLASGFSGGHGTAAAIGQAFSSHGWGEASTLAMTSATVGVVSAIVGGLIIIKWGSKNGFTRFITDFDQLPVELKTGLVPPDKRKQLGLETVSSISIDPLAFHLALIGLTAMVGYYLSQWGAVIIPKVKIPTFCMAFITGLLLQKILSSTKADDYIDKKILTRISGTCTDLLVAFGIAAIKLPVVIKYAVPLALLFIFGIIYCIFVFRYIAPRLFYEYWFEKAIFTWGWATGTMAMGIALLRIVDPDLKSKTLDDFALAYIPMAPVEIAVVSFSPFLIISGQHWAFTLGALGFGIGVLIFAKLNGWWHKDFVTLNQNVKNITTK